MHARPRSGDLKNRELAAKAREVAFAAMIVAMGISSAYAGADVWTQAGSSTGAVASPDDNMKWIVDANWTLDGTTNAVPGTADDIEFNDVTADTSVIANINGRDVSWANSTADFLGTGLLSLTQTTPGFQNFLSIFANNATLSVTTQFGAASIGSGTELDYRIVGSSANNVVRNFTLGAGSTAVTNAGTLTGIYTSGASSRVMSSGFRVAVGSSFTNSGVVILTGNTTDVTADGQVRLQALFGDTTNTGTISIAKSGKSAADTGSTASYAEGGVEFASLNNSGSASNFSYTGARAIKNAAVTGMTITPAFITVDQNLNNDGLMTITRFPTLESQLIAKYSATLTGSVGGAFTNSATGAFEILHTNASTPVSTTFSGVDIAVTGVTTNSGWMELLGSGTGTASSGNIFTRIQTNGGFTNNQGGIITVQLNAGTVSGGAAVLSNTGAFTNNNTLTASSGNIQGAIRTWDTTGLIINSTTSVANNFTWATGVPKVTVANLVSGSGGSFNPANFTVQALNLTTGSGSDIYTLAGGNDIYIGGAGGFSLSGRLDLGDWTGVTDFDHGQTLVFDDINLKSTVDALITSNNIIADNLGAGEFLQTVTNSGGDAFYIEAVPEPGMLDLLGVTLGALLLRRGRRLNQGNWLVRKADPAV